ncbi:ABC transporter permease [Pontibacter chitinilyticus]|uniref:ABC transporter permease n=1 Tax=Pontibacter chitinilyticus TaxID=2674989 RepID=UPI00321A37F1
MLKKLLISFSLALQNVQARLFHTFLSVLGIVIGVAALVTVFVLIDGMEKYAQEQITTTTSLKAIVVLTNTQKTTDNLRLDKENYAYLTMESFTKLLASLPRAATGLLQQRQNGEVKLAGKNEPIAATVMATNASFPAFIKMDKGRFFDTADVQQQQHVAFINHHFAVQALGKDSAQSLLGKSITYNNLQLQVIGELASGAGEAALICFPITLLTDEQLKASPPTGTLEAVNVEDVPLLQAHAEQWLKANFPADTTDFRVVTNGSRVEQAAQGFLLFRLVMGLIVGISVVVGGIGVMNVLLISVTERTVEIGVRKAMGAKKRDVLLQFLAESVTVSLFGSILGLLLGVLASLGLVPLIKAFADVPFQAAYTANTFLLIAGVAVVVGVVFGTYPAMRAARLDPVEAIRRE